MKLFLALVLLIAAASASTCAVETEEDKWAIVDLSVKLYCGGVDPSNETIKHCDAFYDAYQVLDQHYRKTTLSRWLASALYVNGQTLNPWLPNPAIVPTFLKAMNPGQAFLPSLRTALYDLRTKQYYLKQMMIAFCASASDETDRDNCKSWMVKHRGPYVHWQDVVDLWEKLTSPGTSAIDPWHVPLAKAEWSKMFLAHPLLPVLYNE